MSQSLVKNMIHLVFSTKHRAPMIPVEIQPKLWAFQAGVFNNWNSPSIAIGGVDDHIHALFLLSKTHELCKIVEEVKKASSKWMKNEGTGQNDFFWQAGYAAFSVSQSSISSVKEYIGNQAEPHRQRTFQEELRVLLKRHEIDFDERYMWD